MWQKITEIWKNKTLTTEFDFNAVYVDKDGNQHTFNIVPTDLFKNVIDRLFCDRLINVSDTAPYADLLALYSLWCRNREDAYAVRAYGLSLKYNPIDNYDGEEIISQETTDTHGLTVTRTHNDTQTQTMNNSDTRTHADTQTQTNNNTDTDTLSFTARVHTSAESTNGFNSLTAVPTTSTQDTDTGTEEHSIAHTGTIADAHTGTITDAHSGTIADAHTGTIADAHSGTDRHTFDSTLIKHGNLGVTTTAQMLEGEFALLKHDLALQFIYEFLDRFTYETTCVDF